MSSSPSGTGRRLRSVLALGLLLLVVCGLVVAPVSSGTASTAVEESTDGSVDSTGTSTGPDAESGMTIGAALENGSDSGTVEVIVRLSEAEPAPGATPDQARVGLEQHAERTQGEVVSYARSTDGVTIRNRFWVTNAVLLEVDTDRIDLESFDRFEDVSTLHSNFEVELDGATATGASTIGSDDDAVTTTDSTSPAGTTVTGEADATGAIDATDGLDGINAPAVWAEYGANGTGAKVAVLDTGVDVTHPDITLSTTDPSDVTYPGGWAEFDGSGDAVAGSTPRDFGDHGTHVSGTIAGGAASGTHIGVAPGVELLHGAVLTNCDGGCSGSYAQVIGGIQWAVDRNADVASLSLGVQAYEEDFISPVRNAQSAGTIVVSSAGNDGDGSSGSPANVYETFAVGAATDAGEITHFSSGETIVTDDVWSSPPADWPNTYTVPNVAAPGSGIESAAPGGGYQYKSGTSMAAPHVTGSIALLRSINEDLRPAEITAALEETAWKPDGEAPGQDTRYGYGIVDVKAAADATSMVTVTGTVTDRAGEPIDDATVAVDDGRWNATTDETGSYELRVVPGDRTLTVTTPGRHSAAETLELPTGETVTRDVRLDFVETPAGRSLPEPIEANGTVTATFDVKQLEAVTITPTANATVETGGLAFEIDGTRVGVNETHEFDPAVTDGRLNITTYLEAALDGTLELDYEFDRGNETQTVRTGPSRVVPKIYDVGVIASPDNGAAARLETDLADDLSIVYRTSRVDTADAVPAAESGDYDVFVALELPAADATLSNATAAFVDATMAADTGVVYLGDGTGGDTLVRLSQDTAEIRQLETPGHDGPIEIVIDEAHPLFAGVGSERDAVTLLENATNRTWFDVHGARTFASATDDGVLADGTAVALDRSDEQIFLGVTPRAGSLTDDGQSIVTNAVASLGAGQLYVSEDLETYGVSGTGAETATFVVPETGDVTVDFAAGTTVDPADVSLTVNGSDIAPGNETPVDAETVATGLSVDVSVADGVDGEAVQLTATFENETVTTSPIRFELEPPARYAGTVAVNGEPARDGLTVRATSDGTVVAEATTADGWFGVPTADGGGGALEVNSSTVPENATLNLSLERAGTNASITPTAGGESRTDLTVSYDDPFAATTVTAPRWTAAGDEIDVSVDFDGESARYITDRTWLEEYETDPENRWRATHTYGLEDEGVATAGARLTDLAGETRTVSTRVLVIDGEPATINGTISRSATGSNALDGATEHGVNGSVIVTPAHGIWTDEQPVENGTFEAATEENASTHGVFLQSGGEYPIYQTVLDRVVVDETVAIDLDQGHDFGIEVTDESGVGVADASVSVAAIDTSETANAVVWRESATDGSGLWNGPTGNGLGATVNGTITVRVTPPDDEKFVDETSVQTLTVDDAMTASFELAERSDDSRSGGSAGGGGGSGGSAGGGGGDIGDGGSENGTDNGTTPEFEIVASSIDPVEIRAGDSVRIDATVENVGNLAGTDTVTIAANGEALTTEAVDLGPGERETIAVETTLESAASITVDGTPIGTVTVTDESVTPDESASEPEPNGSASADPSTTDSTNETPSTDASSSQSGPQSDSVSGFGGSVAIVAVVTFLLVRARR